MATLGQILSSLAIAAGQSIRRNAGDTAFEAYTPSGGATTPTMKICTVFESSPRFTFTVVGSGTNTFDIHGMTINTTASSGSSEFAEWRCCGKLIFVGSPVFSCALVVDSDATAGTGSSFFGIGAVTVGAAGHTYTTRHIGFKIIKTAGVATLYATQADGTTETASSALTTVVQGDELELIAKVNGTSSVDYYWRLNGGSLSSSTNLTTNIPSSAGGEAKAQFSTSNDNTAQINRFILRGACYER